MSVLDPAQRGLADVQPAGDDALRERLPVKRVKPVGADDAAEVFEQRYIWGRAYRDGRLVCARVHVTIGRDDVRLGLAPHERRYITARFRERLDRDLRAELVQLVRRRGAAARRVADRMEPVVIVVGDPRHGRQRMTGHVQPPDVRGGELWDIEFAVREQAP